MHCAAVICAAGAGARMGQNKALCRLESETFLESIVTVLKSVTAPQISPIVVVTGSQADLVRQIHETLDVVWACNPQWQTTHMLESLTCGLQYVPAGYAVLHWPVDCIGIHHDDLIHLLSAPPAPFTVLACDGKPGHPMRIAPEWADRIRCGQHQFSSLRDFFKECPRSLVEISHHALMNCNDPQTLADFIARCRHL